MFAVDRCWPEEEDRAKGRGKDDDAGWMFSKS